MKRFSSLLATAFLAALFLSSCSQGWQQYALPTLPQKEGLQIDIEPLDNKYDRHGPIEVQFTVTNVGDTPVRINRAQTPLEGKFTTDYFSISHKKHDVYYTGTRRPRNPYLPGLKQRIQLKPGESISGVVDISQGYEFQKGGKYTLAFHGSTVNRLPDSPEVEIKLK
ncbi:MAG: hypothetical protein AAF587_27360 [Bacteroidota bacterium]